jgi:predicted HTH transcriptional regulator
MAFEWQKGVKRRYGCRMTEGNHFLTGIGPIGSGATTNKTREKILRAIMVAPGINTVELAAVTGLTTKGVEWNLKKLKAEGVLKRIGPAKGGHWEVTQ